MVPAPMRPALALVLALAVGPARAAQDDPVEALRPRDRVARVLRDSRHPQAPSGEALVESLVPSVQQDVAAVLRMLDERRVHALSEGESVQKLSEPQTDLLLSALGQVRRARVLGTLRAYLGERDDADARALQLQVLGASGGADQLARVFDLARPGAEGGVEREVLAQLRGALPRLLQRDPTGFERIAGTWHSLPPELLDTVVTALGDTRDPRALAPLIAILPWRKEMASTIIPQIRRVGRSTSEAVNRSAADEVRRWLDPGEDGPFTQAVILALGELGDFEVIPELLEIVASGPATTRTSAFWALRRMTDRSMADDAVLWEGWYRDELDWRHTQRDSAFERLSSPDPARAASAIREIALHRLDRHFLAQELSLHLAYLPSDLIAPACSALGRLGSTAAVPALIDLLAVGDPAAVDAALGALRRITGEELGPDPGDWALAGF